jgi:signal peptidase I
VRRNAFVDYGIIAVVAIALALVIQGFVVKPYRIPSPSMNDTLLPGDRVLVNRLMYHFRDPQRGDVVVFTWPVNRKYVFIKRIIGVPGDTISLTDGQVYVNGARIDEPYVRTVHGVPVPTEPAPATAGTTMSQPWSLQQPYKVPEGKYFMMGDNRIESDDSRDWGPVPADDLIGESFMIYWPLTRIGLV